ncbi:MAG: class I SAM-dependent methyltransferase [Phycisphaerales bacterium]
MVDSYLDPYREAIEQHGSGFDATLWRSREMQQLRFAVMSEMADFADAAILDAGCGSGDFAEWMLQEGIEFVSYTGVDGVSAQILAAQARDLPRCSFAAADFVKDEHVFTQTPADWICFSGSLNTMPESLAREILERAFAAATAGIVFNFLSDRAETRYLRQVVEPAMRFDTAAMLDWALQRSPRVRFRQDYFDGHDATVCIEK